MKIFISWSGDLSQSIASKLKDWIPNVIQSVTPYMSSQDIEKGARWSVDISRELEESCFGIICVTKDNHNSPWINFESGALSKTISNSRVCPLLFNVKPTEINGPLVQFQMADFNKDSFFAILLSINNSLDTPLDLERLKAGFDKWWPELEEFIDNLPKSAEKKQRKEGVDGEAFDELLYLLRTQQRQIRNIERMISFDKRKESIRSNPPFLMETNYSKFSDLAKEYDRLIKNFNTHISDCSNDEEIHNSE